MPKQRAKPSVFTFPERSAIEQILAKLHATQAGAVKDSFTVDDLRLLFVHPDYRKALGLVYLMETDFNARGNIFFDVAATYGPIMLELIDPNASAIVRKAILRMSFTRATMPNGFVTPQRFFGTVNTPLLKLEHAPENLTRRFVDNCELLARVHAEWTLVKWVYQGLEKSLRSPQQMRYVWPAIYPLATAAKLPMDLSEPSPRAGINAVLAAHLRAYLRDSNDIVARSSLIGINEEHMQAFSNDDLKVIYLELELNDQTINSTL